MSKLGEELLSGCGAGTPQNPFKYSLNNDVAHAEFTVGSSSNGIDMTVQQSPATVAANCAVLGQTTLIYNTQCAVIRIITDESGGGLTLNVRGKRNDPGRRHKHPKHPEDGK